MPTVVGMLGIAWYPSCGAHVLVWVAHVERRGQGSFQDERHAEKPDPLGSIVMSIPIMKG